MTDEPDYRLYLREHREFRGLKQSELAAKTGISKSAISRFETGERDIALDDIFRLALAYKISPAELYYDPSDAPPLEVLIARLTPSQCARMLEGLRAFKLILDPLILHLEARTRASPNA
jgi:transcriptional regulator with XRE-family HTH domain